MCVILYSYKTVCVGITQMCEESVCPMMWVWV